ncbi:MAG TPA: 3-phosphoshikimate 1-carboxyvinyltransferase [Gemmatimonas sp.]|nr:3-phosphoshikimate 1-carboxyvinyltransferase [Gemmatimonas sp.]
MAAVSVPGRLVVQGTIRVPGDKSISHRALIFAALATGTSRVRDILQSADVSATAAALRALGAPLPPLSSDMIVTGVGIEALHSPAAPLDCANSGTTTRLLAGLVAGIDGCVARFEGDESLSRRPMARVSRPLEAMGARFAFEGPDGHRGLPMRVSGAALAPIQWSSEHASAQIKGAILLAALASGVEAEITEPERSRDHSERMLIARGVALEVVDRKVRIAPSQRLQPLDISVPADPSSSAFFAALAAMADEGQLRLTDVCLNPTRTGAFDVLQRMGAAIAFQDQRDAGGEPIGTLVVQPSRLHGTRIEGSEIPRCIDELPLLACVAARAAGETVIADAAELRVKESDRIHAVVDNLRRLGVDAEERADGMRIVGSARPLAGHVVTHGDHRLAMAFGILAACPGNSITIDDPACVAVSYPGFWDDLAGATGATSSDQPATGSGSAHLGRTTPMVIAIDGPAASGKSSTAQWVAQNLGVRHVDSGAFYRALTYVALERGDAPGSWHGEGVLQDSGRITWRLTQRSVLPLVDGAVVDDALRDSAVTSHVSRVAQMPEARRWVNDQVRAAAAATDVVVDGRDIGTAVFPDAPLKIFLIADPWERARRRLTQRLGRFPADLEIAAETEALVSRDALDATQSAPARDAITIDTTALTQEEQVERIVVLARAAGERLHH